MKKTFMSLLSLMLTFVLVACGGGGGTSSLVSENETPEQLVVWADATYWGGENGKLVSEMVKLYTQETGIEVIYEAQPDLKSKLRGAAFGGESPDVIIWDRWETALFIAEGRFVKLNDYVEEDEIDLVEYQQVALDEMMLGDDVYGFPLDIDAWGYWVNKTMINQVNLDRVANGLPEVKVLPRTWDELKETAKAATKYDSNGKVTVAGLNVNSPGSFFSYMQTAGGTLLKEENGRTKAAFNSPEGFAVIKYWYDMVHVDKIYDYELASSQGGADDSFVTQRFAIEVNSLLNGTQFYRQYVGDKFEYEFIPFPKGPSDEYATVDNPAGSNSGGLMGGFGLTIPTTAKYKKAGWNLIKWWITDSDKALKWSEISNLVPAKLSIINDDRIKSIPNARNVVDVLPSLRARPKVDGYPSVETSVFMSKIGSLLFENGYVRGNPEVADRIQACLDDMEKTANSIFEFAQG